MKGSYPPPGEAHGDACRMESANESGPMPGARERSLSPCRAEAGPGAGPQSPLAYLNVAFTRPHEVDRDSVPTSNSTT
jgi:hypothetical protein